MQVTLRIGDRDLVALLDSGSTHNFIHEELATVFGLPFSSNRRLGVTVANDDKVAYRGLLQQAAITIDKERFVVDLHAIPLCGFDIVLGTRFLKTLGPILWDFTTQWMSFWHSDHRVEWSGLGSIERPANLHACEGKDLLDSLQATFADVFADPRGLPPRRAHDHHIHLLWTPPVAVRPYRYPTIQKDELERQCSKMLARGLIRPSSSAFSSPVLLIRKHDGTWRFCIDYHGLNLVTIKDKFPIPVVDELLDELKGARFFTKLDRRSDYHQVRMAPEDIHKTAFRTHEGFLSLW
ncbi:RNA-directed DNA polymerase [Hordeum vulgare]|nr:RNA-directed DNA polymerase [Hordeum vulgare]